MVALVLAEADDVAHGLGVGGDARLELPGVDERVEDLVERGVHASDRPLLVVGGGGGDLPAEAGLLQPRVGRGVLLVAQRVELVPGELLHARPLEPAQDGEEGGPERGQRHVRGAEDERLIAVVAAPIEQRGRLGVGAGDDDPGTPMMSSWKRAAERRFSCSSSRRAPCRPGGRTSTPGFWSSMWYPGTPTSTKRLTRLRTCASPPWPVSASAMMNGRKSTSGDDLRCSSVIRARAWRWFLSAVSRARTIGAASSGTWLSG